MKHERGPAVALPLRWALAALAAAVLAFASAGCLGGDESASKPSEPLPAALSHLPATTGLVVVVPTGDESAPLRALERLERRRDGRRSLRSRLERAVRSVGLDPGELRSQLGDPLAVGIGATAQPIAALRVRDPDELQRTVEDRIEAGRAERIDASDATLAWHERGRGAAVRGYAALAERELVLAASRRALDAALAAATGDENIAHDERFVAALGRLGPDALLRSVGDAQRLLARDPLRARGLRRIRWVRALGLLTAVARVERGQVRLEFVQRTDRVPLRPADLPLAPGPRSPRIHAGRAAAAFATLDPDRLARFLERTLAVTNSEAYGNYAAAIDQLRSFFSVDVHYDLLRRLRNISVGFSSPVALSFVAELEAGAERDVTRSLRQAAPAIDFSLPEFLPGTNLVSRGIPPTLWEIRRGRVVVGRYAVRNGAVVGSIGLGRLPTGRGGERIPGVEGSLVAVGDLRRLGRALGLLVNLPAQALDPVLALGDVEMGVRTETSGMTGRGRVALDGGQ